MEESEYNPLKKYLEDAGISCAEFSRIASIRYATLYQIYIGKSKPQITTARRICRFTRGKLTLKDFGH